MMKRLFLLRHAKAVAATPSDEDRERPLVERGRDDAHAMGIYLNKTHGAPDCVLCSPSARTVETWDVVSRGLDAMPDMRLVDALYLAPWSAILKLVRTVHDDVSSLLVIGHNPGMEELADILARKPKDNAEKKRSEALDEKFPTATLAVFHFDTEKWKNIAAGDGELADFKKPKDIG
ncbi:MAG TPA: histidine phosphatase family protein [Rhizomicrobium sp.]|nr:histidine phosphatase family protein [Rhizomicrobium sp.]